MLLSKIVKVRLTRDNYEHFVSKGYEEDICFIPIDTIPYNTFLYIKTEDLPLNSTANVECCCDYCGEKIIKKYKDYINGHSYVSKDCCASCRHLKIKEVNIAKYGTTNTSIISEMNGSISGRKRKYTNDDLLIACKNKNYELLDKNVEIIKVHDKYNVHCNIHNIDFISEFILLNKSEVHNCPMCYHEYLSKVKSKSSIEEVKQICDSKNYILLTEHIKNCDDKIEFMCKKHLYYGKQNTSLYGLKMFENNCKLCNVPKNDSHWHWLGGVSSERDSIKSSFSYRKWVKDVFARDDYTCQCCGKKGGRLEAHHLYNFSEYPELRTVLSNGITLCHDCHAVGIPGSFHDVYTQYHNTPEQFYEYLSNYNQHKQNK